MVKRAHQVFPRAQIHSGLAANRSVHLRQHRSGNLHHFETTHIKGRQQSGNVANDSTSKGDDSRISIRSQAAYVFRELLNRSELFVTFAIGHFQNLWCEAGGGERSYKLFSPFSAHWRDGDNEEPLFAGL